MVTSAVKVSSGESNYSLVSKLKTYRFIISIILGIIGLAVGITGLIRYFHVCALSQSAHIEPIIMMAAGGTGGIILLIIGIIGSIKNRKRGDKLLNDVAGSAQPSSLDTSSPSFSSERVSSKDTTLIDPRHVDASLEPKATISAKRPIDTSGTPGLTYGPEAWTVWNIEILDNIPPPPRIKLNNKDKILLYIPKRIKVNGKEQDLTLKVLKKISGVPFEFFSKVVERELGDKTASGGWVLMDRAVLPDSRKKDYAAQKEMVEKRGCRMPTVLEAVALNLMVFAWTGERLYGGGGLTPDGIRERATYTRCAEKVDEDRPVLVGGFGSSGLQVYYNAVYHDNFGVACVL